MAPVQKIKWLNGACALLVLLAIFLPRFISFQEGGFAASASAVLLFLTLLLAACLISLYLLFMAYRHRQHLTRLQRIAGYAPSIILVTALLVLVSFLSY